MSLTSTSTFASTFMTEGTTTPSKSNFLSLPPPVAADDSLFFDDGTNDGDDVDNTADWSIDRSIDRLMARSTATLHRSIDGSASTIEDDDDKSNWSVSCSIYEYWATDRSVGRPIGRTIDRLIVRSTTTTINIIACVVVVNRRSHHRRHCRRRPSLNCLIDRSISAGKFSKLSKTRKIKNSIFLKIPLLWIFWSFRKCRCWGKSEKRRISKVLARFGDLGFFKIFGNIEISGYSQKIEN